MDTYRKQLKREQEPNSFGDLFKNYTQTRMNDFGYPSKVSTVDLYAVNKKTGIMHTLQRCTLHIHHPLNPEELGSIRVRNHPHVSAMFTILDCDKNDASAFVNTSRFSTGEYALFIHEGEAAKMAKDILVAKRDKLNEQIKQMEELEYTKD